jgi:hypothetical protein
MTKFDDALQEYNVRYAELKQEDEDERREAAELRKIADERNAVIKSALEQIAPQIIDAGAHSASVGTYNDGTPMLVVVLKTVAGPAPHEGAFRFEFKYPDTVQAIGNKPSNPRDKWTGPVRKASVLSPEDIEADVLAWLPVMAKHVSARG